MRLECSLTKQHGTNQALCAPREETGALIGKSNAGLGTKYPGIVGKTFNEFG